MSSRVTISLGVLLITTAVLAASTVASAADASCAGPVIATAAVGRPEPVPAIGAIALDLPLQGTGPKAARLEGVLAPGWMTPADRVRLETTLAAEMSQPATVHGANVRLDRRRRVTGQVETAGWLQERLLRAGLAVYDGRGGPCALALLQAEAEARRQGLGVWSAVPVFNPAEVGDEVELPGFLVVEAKVLSIGKAGSTTYLNFGGRYTTDLTVVIGRRTLAGFPPEKPVESLAGQWVRVRGWAERRSGVEIRLTDPAALEWIEDTRTAVN